MRRPGPRLIAPRAVLGPAGGLSPAPLSSALLVDQTQPITPVWQRWFTALREVVTGLDAGGGGGDADTLDGLDSTDFVQKPMPLADLPAHHATHEPGGSDALVNAAWTNLANVFTQDQTIQTGPYPGLHLLDPTQVAGSRNWRLYSDGHLYIQPFNDADTTPQVSGLSISRTGELRVGGNLIVIGAATMQANASVSGLLTVNGFGAHVFSASGAGGQELNLRNTSGGANNYARLSLGNDATPSLGIIDAYASNFTSVQNSVASGISIGSLGVGGMSLGAFHASGAIRFYTGGVTERMRLHASGGASINTTVDPGAGVCRVEGRLLINGSLNQLVDMYITVDGPGGAYLVCRNYVGTIIGSITELAGNASVAFNTTSDQRLKTDRGVASDVSALRRLVVHDFAWNMDGTPDRGIFAQETARIFPRAVTIGSDGDDLSRPWMTDYSKFVPDLIVGWQDHDARLAALEAAVKG